MGHVENEIRETLVNFALDCFAVQIPLVIILVFFFFNFSILDKKETHLELIITKL